jgi:adenylate cyclase
MALQKHNCSTQPSPTETASSSHVPSRSAEASRRIAEAVQRQDQSEHVDQFEDLNAWLVEAGLRGEPDDALVSGFCERAVAAGLPVSRVQAVIDTLHPVYEGRVLRWGHDAGQPAVEEYGRTNLPEGVSGLDSSAGASPETIARWQASPFFHLLQTGESSLRRRLTAESESEFPVFPELRAAGMTDYVAMVSRFGPEGTIGEMDCLYSSWATARPNGFTDAHIAALMRLVPTLALAVKTATLARMTGTLLETYLGRDAGRRVLSGRIMRGVADHLDTVIWFSDLRGFTRITDSAPQEVIPLLNDYAEVVVSAIHAEGGDVLKFMGDGILAIFTADDRSSACSAALAAAVEARRKVTSLNVRRAKDGLPTTDMYLGLHIGEVYYGNIGSMDRLDFTVIGPAVNEASRIAAMCRSIDQPVLVSETFAKVDGMRDRVVPVGRYVLRGIAQPQRLFTSHPINFSPAQQTEEP